MYCHPGGDCHSGEVNPSYISIWVKSKTGLCSALLFQTSCGGWDQRDPTRQLESVWLALAFIILHFVAAWEDFKEWIHLVSTEMTSTKPDIYRNPRNEKAHWHHLEHAACLHNKDTEGFQITVNSPFFGDDILLGQPLLVVKKKAQFLSTKRRDFIPPQKNNDSFLDGWEILSRETTTIASCRESIHQSWQELSVFLDSNTLGVFFFGEWQELSPI